MLDKNIVTKAIDKLGLGDFSKATIRDLQGLSQIIEKETGEQVIHLEMGVPGLQPSEIALKAEAEALRNGAATQYPPNGGIPRIKKAASEFVKAFIGVDIDPLCCVPTTGSMQGTFATFTALYHALGVRDGGKKDTVLFIQPGFPVQNTQCDVIGLKQVGLDIHDYRGQALIDKLEEMITKSGNIAALVYSNPNNPSWVCFTEEELKGIGALATKYDVIILEDLAYFAMDFRRDLSHPYEAPYQATVAQYTDNYVLWVSGSKAFSYAGQRAGVTCMSNKLYNREYEPLKKFGVSTFGNFFTNRLMYTLSSGSTHSVQCAMSALMEAACDGSYNFLDDVKEYGRRAKFMKDVLLANGFYLVYDNDMGKPLADGFYFTVQYPGMNDLELTKELMYYGIAVFPLDTMGSTQQGVRICTSFFKPEQQPLFKERIEAFKAAKA